MINLKETYNPQYYLTFKATEAIPAKRFVKASGGICGADAIPVGVSEIAWAAGDTMGVIAGGTALIEAGTVIYVGDQVYAGALGKAVNDGSGYCIAGTALTAGAIGDTVKIKLTI